MNKPNLCNKEWVVRHQLIGSSQNKPSFHTTDKKVRFVRPSIQLTSRLVKAETSTRKPVGMSTLVKGEASPRKPMLVKAEIFTRKSMNMGMKAEISTRKPIIENNLASVSGIPINLPPPTKKGSAVFKRNQIRLDTRNNVDEQLMSKLHLPNDLSSVFNPPVYTSDDEAFVLANWFLKAIARVARSTTPTPNQAPFRFSADTSSVDLNTQMLKDSGNNFTSILDQNQDTSLSYKSEFHNPLSSLLKKQGLLILSVRRWSDR